jgi:hypothetical protein
VQQTLADGNKDEQHEPTVVFNAQRYEKFARQFAYARIPDCLHSQALKYQPTFLTGVYAAPFVVLAALRGKCR